MSNAINTTMKATKEVQEYMFNHNRRDSLLYNNNLLFSHLITKDEYEMNRNFIRKYYTHRGQLEQPYSA